ncbi:MAG: serine/threonine protein kinase, partial [bacterium]|nr:serine/threonine protein kinase [bacterium]
MKKPKELKTTFATYTIKNGIEEGGSGKVYSAIDDNGGNVAIKVLDSSKTSKEKLKRFKNELMFSYQKKHPNIITALDHGLTDQSDPFFVMP